MLVVQIAGRHIFGNAEARAGPPRVIFADRRLTVLEFCRLSAIEVLMTDEELLNRGRAGDREALSGLVVRQAKPLTMMILRMVRDKEDAGDISQHDF